MSTHSLSQAAALMGVHRNTLSDWLRAGAPAVERADRERGAEWKLSLPDLIAWRIDRAVADAVAAYGGDGTEMSKEEADRRRAVVQAQIAQIDLDEKLKTVVARADAMADMATFAQVLKTGLSNMASKVAARATSMTSAPEIEVMAKAEMNRAFVAAREEIVRLWHADAAPDASAPTSIP